MANPLNLTTGVVFLAPGAVLPITGSITLGPGADLTGDSTAVIRLNMATPASPTPVADPASGALTAGIYQITVVAVDPNGGLTSYPAAQAITTTGANSHIDVGYVRPDGAVSVRVYTSLVGGATPDRYFTSTSATTYALTTLAGATVAALPTASTAYVMSLGLTPWFGGPVGIGTSSLRDNAGVLQAKAPLGDYMGLGDVVYDDFTRANTTAGHIGTAASGYVWRLSTDSGTPATATQITGNTWVHAHNETAYAWIDSQAPIRTMGASFSFVPADGAGTETAICLALSSDGTIARLFHVTVTTTAVQVSLYVNSPYSNTVLLQKAISAPADSSVHTIEYSITGTWLRLVIDGMPYALNHATVAEFANARHAFFELAHNGAQALYLGTYHAVWASSATGAVTPGSLNLPATTDAFNGVIRINDLPFAHAFTPAGSTGQNTFVGSGAGNWTMSKGAEAASRASYNSILGALAAPALTTGFQNSVLGTSALTLGTTVKETVAIGYQSAYSTLTGNRITSVGTGALWTNSTGIGLVGLGYYAGHYATASDEFYVDNRDRTNTAGDKTGALLYGIFAAAAANQTLTINAGYVSLGPTTGNTTSGSDSFTHLNATIDMATASGTGTGTITVANFFPAGVMPLSFSGRVTTILAGLLLTTFSIGTTGDTNAFGGGLAIAQDTLINGTTYTVDPTSLFCTAATNLVITAAAGVFSTGVLKVTALVLKPIAIGS